MFQNDSRELQKMESTDLKANQTLKAPQAYSTPRLLPLGQASDLVQGKLFMATYKDFAPGYTYFKM